MLLFFYDSFCGSIIQLGWKSAAQNGIKQLVIRTLKSTKTSPTNEDVHNRLKSEYTEYRAKLRKSIQEAKRLYYMYLRLFAIHKNDIQKTRNEQFSE